MSQTTITRQKLGSPNIRPIIKKELTYNDVNYKLELWPEMYNDLDGPDFTGKYFSTLGYKHKETTVFEMYPLYYRSQKAQALFSVGKSHEDFFNADGSSKLPKETKRWIFKPGKINPEIKKDIIKELEKSLK